MVTLNTHDAWGIVVIFCWSLPNDPSPSLKWEKTEKLPKETTDRANKPSRKGLQKRAKTLKFVPDPKKGHEAWMKGITVTGQVAGYDCLAVADQPSVVAWSRTFRAIAHVTWKKDLPPSCHREVYIEFPWGPTEKDEHPVAFMTDKQHQE